MRLFSPKFKLLSPIKFHRTLLSQFFINLIQLLLFMSSSEIILKDCEPRTCLVFNKAAEEGFPLPGEFEKEFRSCLCSLKILSEASMKEAKGES